jgi:hypothetical protein
MAIGGAAGAGAAQLGLGYGLGIIAWLPASNGASETVWKASLAWATWIAATSTIGGALLADRAGGAPPGGSPTSGGYGAGPLAVGLWRVALAVAAAVGALLTVALVAVPARAAVRADTFSPQTIAAGYAVLGVVVGLVVAIGALGSRAVASNLIVTACWLWLLAIVVVVDGVATGRGLVGAQVGVWHFTDGDGGYFRHIYLPGAALSLGAAFVIGGLAALPGARRGDSRAGVAVSGAVGPLLVASAYFLAAPELVGPVAEQLSAYLVAPYVVIAGLAGSVLASALPTPGVRTGAPPRGAAGVDEAGGVGAVAGEPTGGEPRSTPADAATAGGGPATPDSTATGLGAEVAAADDEPADDGPADDGYEPAAARGSAAVPKPRTARQRGRTGR